MRTWNVLGWLVSSAFAVAGCGGKSLAFNSQGAGTDGGDETSTGISTDTGMSEAAAPMPLPIIARAQQPKVSKVDLLFMIDNSSSMADKQAVLALAVPDLVDRLVAPKCIDALSGQVVGVRGPDGSCAMGEPDFEPLKDIHIGIISSSLGGHGSTGVCDQPDSRKTFPHNDDRGHLLTRRAMDSSVATSGNKPFLNWNPNGGYADSSLLIQPFADMVTGVGQHGCGYEAQLESIYRFLIDPNPFDTITTTTGQGLGAAILNGTDQTLLQQRADFLRPDSLVAAIMVTDENDCSIIDGGQNFYVIVPPSGSPARSVLSHGTSACLKNPNDVCCFSCGLHTSDDDPPPRGCTSGLDDSECQAGPWLKTEDPENLRCFHQKQRYGMDFLYPVQRYIDGFTKTTIPDRSGASVRNPLYSDLQCQGGAGCAPARDPRDVYLTGIIGVPWQDIAVNTNDLSLGYKTAKQLTSENIWSKILGNPSAPGGPVLPSDLHMIESVAPRAGLAPVGSAANADPIHGHEWDTSKDSPANRDLQYACTFPLPTVAEKLCTDSTDCDCSNPTTGTVADMKNPLCQGPDGYTTTQIRAKAYPGIRELQVLQGLGDQGIVASICPANVSDITRADFGFRPATAALVGQMRGALRGRCFPKALAIDPVTEQVPCRVFEVFTPSGSACECEGSSRSIAPSDLLTDEQRAQGSCYCEIHQLSGSDQAICRTQLDPPGTVAGGWCYIDPAQSGADECPLVANCSPDDKRIIRFVNAVSEPRNGAVSYIRCDPGTEIAAPAAACQ